MTVLLALLRRVPWWLWIAAALALYIGVMHRTYAGHVAHLNQRLDAAKDQAAEAARAAVTKDLAGATANQAAAIANLNRLYAVSAQNEARVGRDREARVAAERAGLELTVSATPDQVVMALVKMGYPARLAPPGGCR